MPEKQANILHIKNMVCDRCIMVVRNVFIQSGIEPRTVQLGVVVTEQEISSEQTETIKAQLNQLGFELLDDRREQIVEQIKNLIVDLVHSKNDTLKINLSHYLSEKLNHDYSYLSNLFSATENTTIEKYFIAQKIERAKELLAYDELTLNEIADLLNYSSTAHLSSQFKKITGLTPSQFKKDNTNLRKPLDKV